MRKLNKVAALGTAATAGIMVLGAAAWACVAGPTLLAEPQSVAAGEDVSISGISWNEDLPVIVRFDALDGPVLGEFMPDPDSSALEGTVEIPEGTEPGNYVLIGTQESADGDYVIIPSRALVSVQGEGGAPVLGAPLAAESDAAGRPAGLAEADSASTGSLVLAGVGVAGVALFVAGAGVFLTTRKRPEPETATVSK